MLVGGRNFHDKVVLLPPALSLERNFRDEWPVDLFVLHLDGQCSLRILAERPQVAALLLDSLRVHVVHMAIQPPRHIPVSQFFIFAAVLVIYVILISFHYCGGIIADTSVFRVKILRRPHQRWRSFPL